MLVQVVWYSYYCDIFISNIGKIWYNLESFIIDMGRMNIPYTLKRINIHENYCTEDGITLPRYDERTSIEFEKEIHNLCDNFNLTDFNKLWSKGV